MNYNPYDLVPMLINNKSIDGRPFEFDSDVKDQKTMKNAFGNFVKPTKVATMCPDCGSGLMVNIKLGDPPFTPVAYSCEYCHPAPPPLIDPFINPLLSGRVPEFNLDPILHDPTKPLSGSTATSESFLIPPTTKPKPPKQPKSPKQKPSVDLPVTESKPVLEKADGLSEEVDFDFDMVEDE